MDEHGFGPVPHWIDCKERLPGEDLENKYIIALINFTPIVVRVVNGGLCLNTSITFFDIIDKQWKGSVYYAEPTHWCLLPELQK